MSPTPLIELQRRLAEAGRIRMGEKTDKGNPRRLTTWRITSPTRELIDQAANLYGGKPRPWESPTGPQYEVVTEKADLPVLCMPGYSLRQQYEYRTSPTLVERRCDGQEMNDGRPCLCNAEGEDKCDLVTRLTVALPELTTMLGWRLETKGENAARELLASMDLVQGVAGGRPFVPARLRIVERRGNVNGQAVRYVVPVIDVSIRYSELGISERGLPDGYKPVAQLSAGVTLEDGLAATTQAKPAARGRQAAPIPQHGDDLLVDNGPVPVPEETTGPPTGKPITANQRKKMWATAKERGLDEDRVRELIQQVCGPIESTAHIPRDLFDAVLTAIQAEPEPEDQASVYVEQARRAQAARRS